jgi:hypothetical protein
MSPESSIWPPLHGDTAWHSMLTQFDCTELLAIAHAEEATMAMRGSPMTRRQLDSRLGCVPSHHPAATCHIRPRHFSRRVRSACDGADWVER